MKTGADYPVVGVVGPCTAGKSTLIRNLNGKLQAILHHKAQEHSYVQAMWQIINPPAWLVFLDVTYPVTLQRNPRLNWTEEEYLEQQRRLAHARQHADFYLMTDTLSPDEVSLAVEEFLTRLGIQKITAP